MVSTRIIKVCHITVVHRATDVRIFEKECKSLLKNGYDVSIVAPNEEDRTQDGIKILGVNLNSNPISRVLFGAKKIYKKALELDADIYHFHDIEFFSYGLKLKKRGKKVIFDSHENWIEYAKYISWLPPIVTNYVSNLIFKSYKKHLSKFDAVISVTPYIIDILKQFSENVYMVTNYPIINKDNIEKIDKEEFCRRSNKLCYAGTIYGSSNQKSIVIAIQAIENIEYNVVGIISEEMKFGLQQLDINKKVNFVPFIPKKQLIDIYNESTIGMTVFDYSPNLGFKEGSLGVNKIYEYMLSGLPIICSDHKVWKEMIVNKYQCGICVEPGNVEQLKKAIKYLMNNKEEAYKMGQKGQEAVLKEYNWNIQEKELINVYKKMI